MRVSPIFSQFLAVDHLDIDNAAIKRQCYTIKDNDSGRQLSNKGGWQSNLLSLDDLVFSQLKQAIVDKTTQLNVMLGFEDLPIVLGTSWININGLNHFNAPHCHPLSFYSAVYYVKSELGMGELVFRNPFNFYDNILAMNPPKQCTFFNSLDWMVQPKSGDLVIFPSWLLHYVNPNLTNEDRISIAINLTIEDANG